MTDRKQLSKALLAALVLVFSLCSFSKADNTTQEGVEYIQDSVDYSFGSQNWDPPDSVTELTIGDDQRVGVPLDFGFPLGSRVYTYSWMHSNGVVSFLSTYNWMCCHGLDLENYNWNQSTTPYFNHMIAPLWTDTINTNVDIDGDGVDDSGHYTQSYEYEDGTESQRYFWRNVAEYYNNNALNSFALEIYDDGQVDIWHFEVDIRNHDIFVGSVQDFQNDDTPVNGVLYHNRQTGDYTFTATNADDALIYSGIPFDIYPSQCTSNPLYSSDCPGYAAAYLAVQCAASPLYDSSCDGYAEAYAQFEYDRQCTANPLYDTGCSGYATAYYNQQCSLDPLYDTGCSGYETAYYNQQCELDPLYDSGCSGYDTAYYNQQCSLDPLYDAGCPGYATAYYDQQCSLDGLYDTGCPNYETAYIANQCTIDALYSPSCSGYAAALAEQEAGLDNPTQTDYTTVVVDAESFEEPQILGDSVVNDIVFDEPDVVTYEIEIEAPPVEVVQPSPQTVEIADATPQEESIESQIEADFGAIEDEPAEEPAPIEVVEEPVEETEIVEEVVEEETQDEEPTEEVVEEETQEEEVIEVAENEEEASEDESEASETDEAEQEESDSNAEEPSDTEEVEEKPKKETKNEKKKKLARKRAASLAEMMSEAATLEQQQMIQNQIFALVNYNPDFLGYARGLPDVTGYAPTQLPDATINENQRGLRNGLAQQLLHEKMVDSQWER